MAPAAPHVRRAETPGRCYRIQVVAPTTMKAVKLISKVSSSFARCR